MIGAIRDRLKACVPMAADVVLAEDVARLGEGPALKSGTILVMPPRERAEPNEYETGGHRQLVAVMIDVGFLLRRHGDALGGARALGLEEMKDAIEQALAGWSPTPDDFEMNLVGGEGEPLEKGVSLYVQTWQTKRFLTGATP